MQQLSTTRISRPETLQASLCTLGIEHGLPGDPKEQSWPLALTWAAEVTEPAPLRRTPRTNHFLLGLP
jgi:hypothetical protein